MTKLEIGMKRWDHVSITSRKNMASSDLPVFNSTPVCFDIRSHPIVAQE